MATKTLTDKQEEILGRLESEYDNLFILTQALSHNAYVPRVFVIKLNTIIGDIEGIISDHNPDFETSKRFGKDFS